MSTITQKIVKIPKLPYWPTVLCWPLFVVTGDLAKMQEIYNFFFTKVDQKKLSYLAIFQ